MDLLSFPHSAYLVAKSHHILYNGLSAASLVLTSLPSVAFRCRVTLSSAEGHTDCVGTVTVGSETLSFNQATAKTTSTTLTALPTVLSANIDCNVLIEAITASGQDIYAETLTSIQIRYEPTSKIFMSSEGLWVQSQGYAMVINNSIGVGDIIRYNSIDYTTKQVESFPWLDGTEVYRILYF